MIFHAEKRNGFVMMDKEPLNDPRLSLRAKGLLAYLLSKPPDWRPQVQDIAKHCKERPGAIRSAMRELKEAGYASLVQTPVKGRYEGSEWIIRERSEIAPPPPKSAKKADFSEIAVSRNSEKRHPNKNETTTKNERPRGRGSIFYEDFRNYPDPELVKLLPKWEALFADRKAFVAETIKGIEQFLGIKKGDRFYNEWVRRATDAPHRTNYAIFCLEDDVAAANCTLAFCRGPQIRNPSGRADWYFQNVDLDTHHLKEGCRGKRHSKKGIVA